MSAAAKSLIIITWILNVQYQTPNEQYESRGMATSDCVVCAYFNGDIKLFHNKIKKMVGGMEKMSVCIGDPLIVIDMVVYSIPM